LNEAVLATPIADPAAVEVAAHLETALQTLQRDGFAGRVEAGKAGSESTERS